jgi:hypothetical protein
MGGRIGSCPGGLAVDETPFRELLRRVRQRDERAAAELVRRYEPAIRVAVRVRLTDHRLRRLLDSVDVCQSVLANFFVRAASGQFELERPEQLVRLLVTMARNRLLNLAAEHRAARRDQRRLLPVGADEAGLADPGASPSRVVAGQELLSEFRRRLSDEERHLADQRAQGRAWAEIAAGRAEQPNAVRMRLARALDRVARELGLEG